MAHNDQLRFNVYIRPSANRLENENCTLMSDIFDLKVDPSTNKIVNTNDYYNFLNMLNIVLSSNHNELTDIYEQFNSEIEDSLQKQRKSGLIKKLNQTFDVESTKSLWDIWTTSENKIESSGKKENIIVNLKEVDYKKNIIDKIRSNTENNLI